MSNALDYDPYEIGADQDKNWSTGFHHGTKTGAKAERSRLLTLLESINPESARLLAEKIEEPSAMMRAIAARSGVLPSSTGAHSSQHRDVVASWDQALGGLSTWHDVDLHRSGASDGPSRSGSSRFHGSRQSEDSWNRALTLIEKRGGIVGERSHAPMG